MRQTVPLQLPDFSADLITDRGVFSASAIDVGTKVLLTESPHPPSDAATIVDVGCGYGPIAVTMAQRAPGAQVWGIDVNERARALCQENAAALGLQNVMVCAPTDFPDDLAIDRIYSNPPIRIGKAELHKLLDGWLARLAPDGAAYLVVQKHLGADSLARRLSDLGFSVTRISSRRAYRVLEIQPGAAQVNLAPARVTDLEPPTDPARPTEPAGATGPASASGPATTIPATTDRLDDDQPTPVSQPTEEPQP